MGDDEVGRVENANILTGIAVIAQRLNIVDDEDDAVVKTWSRRATIGKPLRAEVGY